MIETRQHLYKLGKFIDFFTIRNCEYNFSRVMMDKFFKKEILCFFMLVFVAQHDEGVSFERYEQLEMDKFKSVMAEFKKSAIESLKNIKKDPSSTPSRKKLCSTLLEFAHAM